MLWQSMNESYDECDFGRDVIKRFEMSAEECEFLHHPDCQPLENIENDAEKENSNFSPTKHDSDISLYSNASPRSNIKCSMICSPYVKIRQPLGEFDLNSRDSGYGTSFTDKENSFCSFSQSETSQEGRSSISPKKKCSNALFPSFSSDQSMDDGFLELPWKTDIIDDENELPCNFNALLSGSIKTMGITPLSHNQQSRPVFRRSYSLKEESLSINRTKNCLLEQSIPELYENRAFKRPEPPADNISPVNSKRYKCAETKTSPVRCNITKVQRSLSATEESIMSAVQRSSSDTNLIGDFSKPFCLPLISGRHQDLKSISPATLADLMRGRFDHAVASYKIIDCRYPYEFKGGHIEGALNYYTKEQILSELVESKSEVARVEEDSPKRHILVFHCEFSSERGPNLSRFLRNLDRTRNNDAYPALHYPEIYLLDGGYKSFYEQFSELCEPVAYKPMLDPAHEHDLRHFRAKSKTWNADTRGRPQLRSSLKRLGFV